MDADALLSRLIRAARDGPDAVLAALEPDLRGLGFAPRATTGEPRAVLWTRGSARLLFSGHVDVVPAGEGWTRDAFGGEVAEGRVWGRGSGDMLGGIAAAVAAAARRPALPCAILLTTDEETGMTAAVHAVREGLTAGFEACVVAEPTSLDVGIAEKGVLWLRVVTRGRNAHGSMPHLGENAAAHLARAVVAVERLPPPQGEHPVLGRPTRNLGTLHSGEAVNQVPALGVAEYDLRYLPGQNVDETLAGLRAAFAADGVPADVEILSHHPPFEVARDHPLVRAAVDALRAAGAEPRILGLPYGTEACKFAPEGLPCTILGPGEPGLAHTNKESIRLDALERGTQAYVQLLERYR